MLSSLIERLEPLNEDAVAEAQTRFAKLTKPRGSLGRLEALAAQLAGISGQPFPQIREKVILLMAADHGVVSEAVSPYSQAVTAQMVYNFLNGGAAINVLARHSGARLIIVDMGVATRPMLHRNLVIRSIGQGTGNIARGPAMSLEQAEQTVIAGVEIVEGEIERGLDIVAMGDMGVGNTTVAAAICAAITGENPERIVDRGSGLDDAGLQRKIATVRRALLANNPDAGNGLDILAKVGGYEIGGLAGAILGAAVHRKPVLLDGVASTAAAMIAATLAPRVRPYLIASHHSESNVHGHMLDWLGLKPLISLNLTLGEGAGAALTFSIIEAACKLLTEMATLTEAGIPT